MILHGYVNPNDLVSFNHNPNFGLYLYSESSVNYSFKVSVDIDSLYVDSLFEGSKGIIISRNELPKSTSV